LNYAKEITDLEIIIKQIAVLSKTLKKKVLSYINLVDKNMNYNFIIKNLIFHYLSLFMKVISNIFIKIIEMYNITFSFDVMLTCILMLPLACGVIL